MKTVGSASIVSTIVRKAFFPLKSKYPSMNPQGSPAPILKIMEQVETCSVANMAVQVELSPLIRSSMALIKPATMKSMIHYIPLPFKPNALTPLNIEHYSKVSFYKSVFNYFALGMKSFCPSSLKSFIRFWAFFEAIQSENLTARPYLALAQFSGSRVNTLY